jgi:1,4-dihydroxy-2-naphthoate octaprenyltransferase
LRGAPVAMSETVAVPARRWRAWVIAARVPTLTAAVAPILVGTAVASRAGALRPLPALAALVVALCLQIGTNYSNDALDYLRGADTHGRRGPTRATQRGLLAPRQVLLGAYLCVGLAGLAGLYLVAVYGWPVLVAGVLAAAAGLGYTGGPWPLAYHAFGEVVVFAFFGVMAVVGTAYVQMGRLSLVAAGASVPVGLLAAAILIVNNLRDIDTDRTAGKRTLAVRIGERNTRVLYRCCLAGATAAPAVLRLAGLLGDAFWLPWLTTPLLVSLARASWSPQSGPALNRTLVRTAQLHFAFGVLLAASLAR